MKTLSTSNLVVIVSLTALITSCDKSPKPPPTQQLKSQLSLQLPGWCSVRSFTLQVTENMGSKVEPIFKSRFQAEVEFGQDTFKLDSTYNGVSILALAFKGGSRQTVYGVTTSSPKGESWETNVVLETSPEQAFGLPRSSFSGRSMLKGSSEEAEFRAKVQAEREEATRRAAEVERQRKEQEARIARDRDEREEHHAEQRSAIKLPMEGKASEFEIVAYPDDWTAPVSFSGIQNFNLSLPGAAEARKIYAMLNGDERQTLVWGDRPVQWPAYINSMQFKPADGRSVKIRVTLDTRPH